MVTYERVAIGKGGDNIVAPAPRIIQWDDPPIREKPPTSNQNVAKLGVVSSILTPAHERPKRDFKNPCNSHTYYKSKRYKLSLR